MPRRYAAHNTTPRPSGNTNPFNAPTTINVRTGRPTHRNTKAETDTNPANTQPRHRSTRRSRLCRNETDVYADPVTDVIAALHITTPNKR